ncbi:hypothetical protein CTheo_1181 [Ceratobasidium theobromae]|uniref:Zn(2)-C6 fungal-type domain-containing protein n=1 Tax=Ceratobasidium theobromae TaxID=1582974 RepID=A0A5N5QUK7_9AGAM|nr:hypothetical protein CTheo_1181 [Ceratobasidium theobromae]
MPEATLHMFNTHLGAWAEPQLAPHYALWFGDASAVDREVPDSPTDMGHPVEESSEPDVEDVDQDSEQDAETGKRARHHAESQKTPERPRKRRRSGGKDSEDGGERERKMSRSSRACLGCRRYKVRCMPGPTLLPPDENAPCARCTQNDQRCQFTQSNRGKYPVKKYAQLKKLHEHLEEMLRFLTEVADSLPQTQSSHAGPSSSRFH